MEEILVLLAWPMSSSLHHGPENVMLLLKRALNCQISFNSKFTQFRLFLVNLFQRNDRKRRISFLLSSNWTYWTRKGIHVTAAGFKLTQTIFANLAKWLIFVVRSYLYGIIYCVFLTSLSQMLIEWIFVLKLPERQRTCCLEKHDILVTSMGGELTTLKLVTEHSLV